LIGIVEIKAYLSGMEKILEKLRKLESILNEKQRRIVFAAEAEQIGRGGKSKISALTGMSRSTLNAGFADLKSLSEKDMPVSQGKIRRSGGGRKKITQTEPRLTVVL
jgi:hypothetical protein